MKVQYEVAQEQLPERGESVGAAGRQPLSCQALNGNILEMP